MARVDNLPVLTAPAGDEAALAESALHVAGTGLPWQEEANAYIAGHRIGFEGEASHLVFYDLNVLTNGDEIVLTDAEGTRYVYRVFRSFVVGPSDYHVTFPTPGKNVVSLQTCTPIPTFEERLVVQAELADVSRRNVNVLQSRSAPFQRRKSYASPASPPTFLIRDNVWLSEARPNRVSPMLCGTMMVEVAR